MSQLLMVNIEWTSQQKQGLQEMKLRVSAALLAAASMSALIAGPAFAQESTAGGDSDSIVVQGYKVIPATLAIPTTLLDTPRSIEVVEADVWEDRNVTHPNEALRMTAGFAQSGTYGGFRPGYSLRSFGVNRILDDGFNVIGTSGARTSELAAFSRIEVLKGPAGAEYGNISSGGIINFVSRLPTGQQAFDVSAQFDSHGQRRGVIDADLGDLGSDVGLRVAAAYENSDSFRDYLNKESVFISPALRWNPGENTRVSIVLRHQEATGVFDQMFPSSPLVLDLPVERFFGEPTDSADFRTTLGRIWIEHDFSENITLRVGANRSRTKYTNSFWSARGSVNVAQRSFTQVGVTEKNTIDETVLQANLRGSYDLAGGWRSDTLFAMEAQREQVRPMSQSGTASVTNFLDAPVYGRIFPTLPDVFRTEKQEWLAATVQQQFTLRHTLTLNAGVRVDFSHVSRLNEPTNEFNELDSTNASPFVGISYRPLPWLSVYANYATSFSNQIGTQLANGANPDPLLGRQFEGGIKVGSSDGRLAGTVSVFEVTQRNVLTASEIAGVSIQTGEVRTRGFEVDVSTEIFEGMHTQLAYTYLDAEVTEDTIIAPGTSRLTNNKHNFNLWTEYRPAFAGGFGLGAGVFHVGSRHTSDTSGFTLPAYTRLDASLSYEAGDWRTTLYVENLTDEKYFYTSGPVLAPQAPLTASLRVAKRF